MYAQPRPRAPPIILIAHNLDEVLSIADRVTVLRNGKLIATLARNAIDYDGVVEMIVGRELARGYQKAATTVGEPLMVAEGFVHAPSGESRTIALKQSEIIGIPTYVGAMVDQTLGELTGLTPYGGSSLSIGGRRALALLHPGLHRRRRLSGSGRRDGGRADPRFLDGGQYPVAESAAVSGCRVDRSPRAAPHGRRSDPRAGHPAG